MKVAVFIMSGFAALWYVWGLAPLSPVPAVALAPVLVTVTLMVMALRAPAVCPVPGVGRVVGLASAAEGVAIVLALNVLNGTGLGFYFPAAVATIVGLHFLPIARHLAFRPYYAAAAAMVVAAVAGVAVHNMTVTCWASAVVLWVTCGTVVARAQGRAAMG